MRDFMIGAIFAVAASFSCAAVAQEDAPAAQAPVVVPVPAVPKPATVIATMQTGEGPIVLALEKERAPITTRNFLRYIDEKRLDGATFYRAVNMGDNYGLVQGGVRMPQKLLPPIAHEPTSQTGLSHVKGAISMARAAEGTAQSDFFILAGDMKGLDANPAAPGDNSGFAVFGHVVEGMDVVRKIMSGEISPTLGADNGMQGQMLAAPVKMLSARRTPDYKPAEAPPPAPDSSQTPAPDQ